LQTKVPLAKTFALSLLVASVGLAKVFLQLAAASRALAAAATGRRSARLLLFGLLLDLYRPQGE
jgi:hypothetical protein